MKKKILTSLFSATILLSTVAPVVSVIHADDYGDQPTEPEIPTDSSIPEEVPSETESSEAVDSSTEVSEEPEIPEESTEPSDSTEEPIIPAEPTYPEESEESEESQKPSQSTQDSDKTSGTTDFDAPKLKPKSHEKKETKKEQLSNDSQTSQEAAESVNTKDNSQEKVVTLVDKKGNATNQSSTQQKNGWTANRPEDIDIKAGDTEYVIQWGDTLWAISIKAETTVDHLASLNNIQNVDLIYAGNLLNLK